MPNRTKPQNANLNASDGADYKSFIENLPVMFYAVAPEPPHLPLYISPTFAKFGYPIKEWMTQPDIWDRIIHPDDRAEVLDNTRAAMRAGESIDFEYRVICADGRIVWVRDRSCFIYDEAGKKTCWQGVILDVDERKRAQHELEKREKLYRTLARTIPKTAVLLFDHDFRYSLADGEQLANHDWSPEMFEGQTLSDIFPPDWVEEWSGYYTRALAGEHITFENRLDDSIYQITVRPVHDDNGDIFAGMVMWQDISDAHRATDALLESEERYRRLFENANDIIYVHDLQGNYISINEAGCRIFGYSKDEVLSLNMSQIAAPYELELMKEKLARKLAGDTSQTVYEVECIRKDGTLITLEVNSNVITKDGKPIAVQGVARDVTERKIAEEALRKSESNLAAAQRLTHLGSWELTINNVNNAAENTLVWSEEVYRIFGFEPYGIDVTTELVYASVHKEDLPHVSEAFTRAALDNTLLDIEARVYTPEGIERLVHAQAETIKNAVGTTVAMVGTIQDVTESRNAELALRSSEAQFRDLFENANDLIYTHDLDGNITSLNRAGEIITGYTREEALRVNISQVVAPEFLDKARQMTSEKLRGKTPTSYEVDILTKDGQRVLLDLSTRLIMSNGVPVGVQGLGRDITARRRAESKLRDTLSLFETTFESTADGIVVMGLDKQIVTCNKKFVEMWQVPQDMIDRKDGPALVQHVANNLVNTEEFLQRIGETYKTPDAALSEILELRDGRILERYSQPQYLDGKPIGRVASFRDITERSRAEERLRHYALHDTLTDLPNRVQFMQRLEEAVQRTAGNTHAKFAVLFLDLDRFKVINDSLGHAIGDKLLIAISDKLQACVRPGDVVARLGGDEFTILLNRSGDVSEVVKVAERLQTRISEPVKIDNYEVFTTASIGIVVAGNVERTAEDFLRDADAAMYRAKEAGKARYEVFDREMHVRNMNLLQIETDLRHAVEREEFEVLYQPIVDLVSGGVSEFEALIRWRHPEHGLVGPNEFVHVAEETGLIIPIGKWILEESCRQIAEWQGEFGDEFSISVNLSAKQLMHPTLTSQVENALLHHGLHPSQLKLEVTESTVMEHSDRALKILSELDSLGVSLSTDDFGTGYSSLSYLQKFPFERLKIDRSFVALMDSDEKSALIVKTILMLGENLNLQVVAEGIETAAQLRKLRELGCTLGQGYLFARPLEAKLAADFLQRESAAVFSTSSANIIIPGRNTIEVEQMQ
ncbi:MAG TPA: PAS domain S-box protein [Pyrinomonadaceae bacterium]|nr:PAS domain S-box protein [Pyrinomonadaceae bacterium]